MTADAGRPAPAAPPRPGRGVWPALVAQAVGTVGTQVTALALPTLAILDLGASPFVASALFALEFGAQALVGPLLGVVVDRARSPRRLLMTTSVVQGLVIASVPLAYAWDAVSLPLLAAVAAITGVLGGLTAIGVPTLVPSLVPADRLVGANAALAGARSVGQVAGPAVAGWLVQIWGAALAMVVDAISYGVSVLAFAALRPAPRATAARDRPGLVRSLREGADALRGQPVLVRIAVTAAALNFGGSALGALYLVYAYHDLRLSPLLVGVAYVVNSVASLVAVATASRVVGRLGLGRVVPAFAPVAGASLLLIPAGLVLPGAVALIAYEAAFGYCATVWFIATAALQQSLVPEHQLGRVIALGRTLGALALPVGALLGGALAEWWGVPATVLAFALIGAVGATLAAVRRPRDSLASVVGNKTPTPVESLTVPPVEPKTCSTP